MSDIDEVYKNSGLGKWFHKQSAGGEPGWDRYNSKGEKAGKCGDSKPGEPYAACLSKQKAAKLGKKGVKSFVLRKRAKQREAGKGKKDIAGKGNKPVNVKTGVTDKDPNKRGIQEMGKAFEDFRGDLQEKNVPTNPKLWSSVISQARSKFDVYPSAYANAWASKEYKKKGGGWRKSKGKVDEALMVALEGGLQEGYKFKKTKTEKNKSEEGNQTIVHFDIMQNGKKIGQIKVDDYFGKMVGTVHGKNIPNGMHGHPDTIQKDFDGFMKSKTAQRLFKGNMREEVEQVEEATETFKLKAGQDPKLRAADPKDKELDKFLQNVSKMIRAGAKPAEVEKAIRGLLPLMKARGVKLNAQQKAALKQLGLNEESNAAMALLGGLVGIGIGSIIVAAKTHITAVRPARAKAKKSRERLDKVAAKFKANIKKDNEYYDKMGYPKTKNEEVEQVDEKSAAWQRKEGKNREGGLNAAGRRSYERENPGSDLKAPVSAAQAKKSKGGKAAKRRKSFCARMGGMKGPMKDEKGRPTRKALALRKWDC